MGREFYERPTLVVAKELLGKLIEVRNTQGQSKTVRVGRIVETEGYTANDPASHASKGLSPRCAPMFEEPGRAYVYFIYGMYEMLNFVTEKEGTPGAVLIRAIEWLEPRSQLNGNVNGPGKLTRALGIRRSDNRKSLQGPRLTVLDDGFVPHSVSRSPRVGISKGQESLWRFFISDHPMVSKAKENKKAEVL